MAAVSTSLGLLSLIIFNNLISIGQALSSHIETIKQCYKDIEETMTDTDGDCQAEMEDIEKLIDAEFKYCAHFSFGEPITCVNRDQYLTMMTDTKQMCGTFAAAIFYLYPTESKDSYEMVDVSEYSKPKTGNCVQVLHETVKVEYDSNGLVHTVTETKFDSSNDKEICNRNHQNVAGITYTEFTNRDDGYSLVTSNTDIDYVRADIISFQPNSPKLVDAYKKLNSNGMTTYLCKITYDDGSTFDYIKYDHN